MDRGDGGGEREARCDYREERDGCSRGEGHRAGPPYARSSSVLDHYVRARALSVDQPRYDCPAEVEDPRYSLEDARPELRYVYIH